MDDLLALVLIFFGCFIGFIIGFYIRKKLVLSKDIRTNEENKEIPLTEKTEENPFIKNVLAENKQEHPVKKIEDQEDAQEIHLSQRSIPPATETDDNDEQKYLEKERQYQEKKFQFDKKMKTLDENTLKSVSTYILNNSRIFFDLRYKNNLKMVYSEYLSDIREKLLKRGYSFDLVEVEWLVDQIKKTIEPKIRPSNDD